MRCLSLLLLCLATAASVCCLPEQAHIGSSQPVHIMEGWSYIDCGLQTDAIQIESISVYPDPPQPGKNLIINVTALAQERIEEGAYADVVLKLGLVKLLSKRFDVCEEARNAKASIQCPVEPGKYTLEHTVALPKEIPKAKFTVDVRGFTVDEDDMLCLKFNVDFMKRFSRFW